MEPLYIYNLYLLVFTRPGKLLIKLEARKSQNTVEIITNNVNILFMEDFIVFPNAQMFCFSSLCCEYK
jgi:hypothetical protein